MSKKRGLSLDQKQEQMLKVFQETQSFFQLKDLEKLGPKKGVVRQTVKDVVQALVDDGLVLKDKIGTTVYFWSLPSRAGNQLRQSAEKVEKELAYFSKREAELKSQLELLKNGREEDPTKREADLTALTELEKKHKATAEELEGLAENDPSVYEAMEKASEVAHTAANRWTDNIFAVQQWCNNNFPEAKENLDQMYAEVGITEDFDYVEA
ncbi:unnamed protein product [Calypogeia fissa]